MTTVKCWSAWLDIDITPLALITVIEEGVTHLNGTGSFCAIQNSSVKCWSNWQSNPDFFVTDIAGLESDVTDISAISWEQICAIQNNKIMCKGGIFGDNLVQVGDTGIVLWGD